MLAADNFLGSQHDLVSWFFNLDVFRIVRRLGVLRAGKEQMSAPKTKNGDGDDDQKGCRMLNASGDFRPAETTYL